MDRNLAVRWQEKLREATRQRIEARVLAAFNANIDVVVHLNGERLQRVLSSDPELTAAAIAARSGDPGQGVSDKFDLLACLQRAFASGKSFHVTVEREELLDWLRWAFPDASEHMGGQAGIIANQMAMLGASSTAYVSLHSPVQAKLFAEGVLAPVVDEGKLRLAPAREVGRPQDPTKINWIFEYPKGERFLFGDQEVVTPRANRLILATHPKKVLGFDPEIVPHLPDLGARIDVAFLAGYHHAAPQMPDGRTAETYLAEAVEHLHLLRRQHGSLRLHYEYVPMRYAELEGMLLERVCGAVDSFGINEVEIRRVLDVFGFQAEREGVEAHESAHTLYAGGLALLRRLRLRRIQIHNLGYYVIVLSKPWSVSPERSLAAGLFGSAVNAMKAKYGGYVTPERLEEARELPLSDVGLSQVEAFQRQTPPGLRPLAEGIWEGDDHAVLVVPAHIVPNPVSTVGMGDTISSSTFAMEQQAEASALTARG